MKKQKEKSREIFKNLNVDKNQQKQLAYEFIINSFIKNSKKSKKCLINIKYERKI